MDMVRLPGTQSMAKGTNPASEAMPPNTQGIGYESGPQENLGSAYFEPSATTPGHMPGQTPAVSSSSVRSTASGEWHADPWRLEKSGDDRGLYELQRCAVDMRRHIQLARVAALQFQCFDAFARLSMSFGTHQFLFALSNYALGYVSIMDGATWPGWC